MRLNVSAVRRAIQSWIFESWSLRNIFSLLIITSRTQPCLLTSRSHFQAPGKSFRPAYNAPSEYISWIRNLFRDANEEATGTQTQSTQLQSELIFEILHSSWHSISGVAMQRTPRNFFFSEFQHVRSHAQESYSALVVNSLHSECIQALCLATVPVISVCMTKQPFVIIELWRLSGSVVRTLWPRTAEKGLELVDQCYQCSGIESQQSKASSTM